jgi:hypothetical protein
MAPRLRRQKGAQRGVDHDGIDVRLLLLLNTRYV